MDRWIDAGRMAGNNNVAFAHFCHEADLVKFHHDLGDSEGTDRQRCLLYPYRFL